MSLQIQDITVNYSVNESLIENSQQFGNIGPQGLLGPQGLEGSNGIQGNTGYTGPQGLSGLSTNTGPTGYTGPQGLLGPQGHIGPQGIAGPQGTFSGTVNFSQGTDITLLTGNNNNYVLSSGTLFLISSAAGTPTLTGFTGGSIERYIICVNTSAVSNLKFSNEDTASTDINRFTLNTNTTISVGINRSATFIYGTSSIGNRWILTSAT